MRARRSSAQRLARAADLGGAGEEDEHVARPSPSRRSRRTARGDLLVEPVRLRGVLGERCSTATSKRRPSERSARRRRGSAATGAASSVADMTTSFRSGRRGALEPAQEREREVAVEVALVELVEDDRADRRERGVGEEPPGEEPLGDEADPRPRAGDLLEADLVADASRPTRSPSSSATRRAASRAASRRGSSTTTSPSPASPASSSAARHARRLARAGRRLDDERRRRAQRGDDLRAGAGRSGGRSC